MLISGLHPLGRGPGKGKKPNRSSDIWKKEKVFLCCKLWCPCKFYHLNTLTRRGRGTENEEGIVRSSLGERGAVGAGGSLMLSRQGPKPEVSIPRPFITQPLPSTSVSCSHAPQPKPSLQISLLLTRRDALGGLQWNPAGWRPDALFTCSVTPQWPLCLPDTTLSWDVGL